MWNHVFKKTMTSTFVLLGVILALAWAMRASASLAGEQSAGAQIRRGSSALMSEAALSLQNSTCPGALIVVAGRLRSGDPLQSNIHYVTDAVYRLFRTHGYPPDQIYYLATDPTLDPDGDGQADVDALPSEANLEHAITQWAIERVGPDRFLTLYLVGHGTYDCFYLDGTTHWLAPDVLDGWLDALEAAVPGVKVNVIVEAGYSGSFIDLTRTVSQAGRVVITSTGAQALAWFSPDGAAFSDAFLNALASGVSLGEAFEEALWVVEAIHSGQTPWLDDRLEADQRFLFPTSGDTYEPDDICAQAGTILTDGTVQVHTFHDQGDTDWIQFAAISGTTYIIETSDPGPNADTTLELYNQCDSPAQDFDDDAFGPTSRLTFNCIVSGTYYVRVAHHDPTVYGAGTAYSLSVRVDTLPPAPPQDLVATPGDTSIALQWRPNDEPDVVGYQLHYGTRPGAYVHAVDVAGSSTAAYILSGLTNGITYYLTLSAVDFGGNESSSSAEVSAVPDPGADTTAPTVVIQQPTTAAVYTTTQAAVLLTGTCQDSEGHLNYVHVVNAVNGKQRWDYAPQGYSDTFVAGSLPLEIGDNAVVATAFDTAGNWSTDLVTIRRVEGQRVAIIVAGHNELYRSQRNIYNVTNRAYRLFRQAGFRRDHITYLSPEPQDADLPRDGLNDVDGDSTPADLETAITTWAVDKVGPGVPLFIYLMDHGGQDYFCADGCGEPSRVWADELDGWLSALESATGADNVNVIIEACHSGSFIEEVREISKPGRVVIASTAQGLAAYASPNGAFFSDAFLTALEGGADLGTAFTQATAAVSDSVGVIQQPWLDDNSNATHNDAGDGALAATRYLLAAMVGSQPTIIEAQATAGDASTMNVTAHVMDLMARVERGDGRLQAVWAAIYPPSWVPPDVEPGETPEDGADLVELTDPDGDGIYTGMYTLGEQGAYRVVFHGVDVDGSQAVSYSVTLYSRYTVYLPLALKE